MSEESGLDQTLLRGDILKEAEARVARSFQRVTMKAMTAAGVRDYIGYQLIEGVSLTQSLLTDLQMVGIDARTLYVGDSTGAIHHIPLENGKTAETRLNGEKRPDLGPVSLKDFNFQIGAPGQSTEVMGKKTGVVTSAVIRTNQKPTPTDTHLPSSPIALQYRLPPQSVKIMS